MIEARKGIVERATGGCMCDGAGEWDCANNYNQPKF